MRKLVLLIAAIALVSGCAIKSSHITVIVDGSKTDYTKLDKLKSGEACATMVLGIPTSMDKSVSTAAKNGGVSTIKHIDEKTSDQFFVRKSCTVVYGS
ncbi:MAG: TRL-like family protein [Gammaproteobacteria bacterium]|nr:TRL-like family protein [Gammaproteobacteria bacterium]